MAQDSEKRFHQIMDKLFTPSKSPLPPSSSTSLPVEQQSRGKKRPNPSSALALVEPKTTIDRSLKAPAATGGSQSGLCRPWDRGDLMRRLASFKSMTWFAKPQVISALNCARRGWVNDDTDTISCESCGAHLYFSAPASWSKQQVEKAASVFSLKLDNGHKLLCPWIENSCEETLSEFPSMTPQDLVERHEERSEALLQLLALPVIEPSAIDYMKSSDLEEFLKRPASGDKECSQTESLINHVGASPAQLFYQAQKLISLCGWEPRALPYIVDCKDKSGEAAKGTDTIDLLPETATRELLSSSSSASNSENPVVPDTLNSDPSSVVLDCKLCGACVGLWVFSTVPRPLELCRVTGDTEVSTESNSRDGTLQRQTSSLQFTIAGGPPATKQNFKATISLPIVGRNLRSRFASYSRDRDHGTGNSIQDQQCKTPERNGGGTENIDQDLIDVGENADGGKNTSDLDSYTTPQTKDKQLMVVTSSLPENNKPKDSTGDIGKSNKQMEFDPIKQHRHFCPWIWSTGRRGPGWRQTLSALQRPKGSCQTPPSPSSIFKVDDPLTSVRNLFKSPSPKRARLNRGSPS
ncbi:C3HC-type domain-containing protein [Hirschfeldia incana]|nr:C3HC-type domain-containing protein [Hirschfeldia incana]